MHPEHFDLFKVKALKSQFYKILRAGLRKLLQFINKYQSHGIPTLIKLPDSRIRLILRTNGADKLRLKIL